MMKVPKVQFGHRERAKRTISPTTWSCSVHRRWLAGQRKQKQLFPWRWYRLSCGWFWPPASSRVVPHII